MYIAVTHILCLRDLHFLIIIFFFQIEIDIEKYKTLGKIYLIGDLNSRTSNISDILDYDSYLDYFDSDLSYFINITSRVNKDQVNVAHGQRLIGPVFDLLTLVE